MDNILASLLSSNVPRSEKIYARLDENNIVANIEMATEEFVLNSPQSASYVLGQFPSNTKKKQVHIGMIYNRESDYFTYPQPHPSWTLDENYDWIPPVPFPSEEGDYEWDETILNWKKL